jgi:hypothetical protein
MIALMMNSVEPLRSALSTTSLQHSGWTRILYAGFRATPRCRADLVAVLGAEELVHRAVAGPEDDLGRRICSAVAPPRGRPCEPASGHRRTSCVGDIDPARRGGVAPQVLIGQEQDLDLSPGISILEPPVIAQSKTSRALLLVQHAPPCSPTNALIAADEFT